MCNRRALRFGLTRTRAGIQLWLGIHIIELFSDPEMEGKCGEGIGKGPKGFFWLEFGEG